MTPSQRGRSRCGQIARTASRVVHAADARGSVPKRQGAHEQGCVLFHLSSQHQVTPKRVRSQILPSWYGHAWPPWREDRP